MLRDEAQGPSPFAAGRLVASQPERRMIQPWLRKLTELAHVSDEQVILISHHPEAINYLAADSAWRVWRDPQGGHSRIEPDLDVGETAYDLAQRSA